MNKEKYFLPTIALIFVLLYIHTHTLAFTQGNRKKLNINHLFGTLKRYIFIGDILVFKEINYLKYCT